MTDMFVRMLEKDSPLHCALLEDYTKNVRTLLDERCDVSAVDSGGRTVMHIIAQNFSISWDLKNHNSNYKVTVDNNDCVL